MSIDIDESILANMTEEERAALEAPDGDSEHQEVDLDAIAAQQQEQQEQQQEEPGKKEEGEPGGKAEEPAAEEQQPVQQEKQPEAAAPQPVFRPVATEELNAKYADIQSRVDALAEKFDDGDLTTKEYNAQLQALIDERGELKWLERKDELNRESVEQMVQQQWQAAQNEFLPKHPVIGENEENWNSFDAVVRLVTAARAAEGKSYGVPELERAYRIWADERGIATKPAEAAKPEQKAEEQPKPKAKALDLPPSLAKVPAAAMEDTDDGKFAALDRMAESDPQKFQETIAGMSPSEYDAYSSR